MNLRSRISDDAGGREVRTVSHVAIARASTRVPTLSTLIAARRADRGHPIVVGVSGYGGAGKSTLAREVVSAIPESVRMRGDDFLDPVRSHRRSADWDGVERSRLVREVLTPFRTGRSEAFRRFDWNIRALGEVKPVPLGQVMVVDLIGLFHPAGLDSLDLTIWCDVDLATAQSRGMQRDAALGRDHSCPWDDVWVPNQRDFDAHFSPRASAEILVPMP